MSEARAAEPSPIAVRKVEMPSGGGGAQGLGEHLQAGEYSGELSFAVPIGCSACRGSEPRLQLSYSSFAGNSVFGHGFGLALGSISRQTSRRIPRYDDTDVFMLDGEPLTPVRGGAGTRVVGGTTYEVAPFRPRTEARFERVERWRSEAGETFWRVQDRGATTFVYGRSAAARVADPVDPGRVAEWLLETVLDPRGDALSYRYKEEDGSGVPRSLREPAGPPTAARHPERILYGNDAPYASPDGGVTPLPEQEWHFEVVFDYGEYDLRPENDDPYSPVGGWTCRADPFSSFQSGIEERTYRLCRGVLMFHRFPDLGERPVLVHALTLDYDEDPAGTTLASCCLVGYRHYPSQPSGRRYVTRATPRLALAFGSFRPEASTAATPLSDCDGEPVEGFAMQGSYAVTDLYGDGVPGILYADGESLYYRSPQLQGSGAGASITWSARRPLAAFPVERSVAGGGATLVDLDGNGVLDLVSARADGFYRSRRGHGWENFALFPAGFDADGSPAYAAADLTGDGRADLVWTEPGTVGYFPALGEEGFAAAERVAADPSLPPSLAGDPAMFVAFADVLGGGVPCLVRVTQGSVECWPSLGYGRLGPVVKLDGAPSYDGPFDASRVWFADVDGSGAPALVYAYADRIEVFRNLAGNGFAAQPVSVPLPAAYSHREQVRFEDLQGGGYECLVFSTVDPVPQAWTVDLCGGRKPHLLEGVDSGTGNRTSIGYRSSAHYLLLDRREGREWITQLPFPLQVVEEIAQADDVAEVTTTASYRYHHGHYDHVEREYRGFGMVEQLDVEAERLADGSEPGADPAHVPPRLAKTWHHTGAWLREGALEQAYRSEYWDGDAKAWTAPPTAYDLGADEADPETARQAAAAMGGAVLREEHYGLDGDPRASVPYGVVEHAYRVRMLQRADADAYGSFFGHREQVTDADYERVAADPHVSQHFVLDLDDYGNVELECTVACARREGAADPARGQADPRLFAVAQTWNAITDQPDAWLLGEPASEAMHELDDPPRADVLGLYYSLSGVRQAVEAALAAGTATLYRALRFVYEPDPRSGATITPAALLRRREEAAFADAVVSAAFAGQSLPGSLSAFLEAAGYVLGADGLWWNPSASERYADATHFYLPAATSDPLASAGKAPGTVAEYAYDRHDLLLTSVTMRASDGGVLPSVVTATEVDYQALTASRIVDENGDAHEAARDPLGAVIALSFQGTEWRDGGPVAVGFAPLDLTTPLEPPPSLDALMAAPGEYLGGAAEYFWYDLDAWQAGRGPTVLASLVATEYLQGGAPAGEIEIDLNYLDGSHRVVQATDLVEPGPATLYDGSGPARQGEANPRYRTRGRVRYNDKGLPFKSFEPYFVSTYRYVEDAALGEFGVSSTVFYDALGRAIEVKSPKGGFADAFSTRADYGPWATTHWDAVDTIEGSPYYRHYIVEGHDGLDPWERDALVKAASVAETPETHAIDSLGQLSELRRLAARTGPPLVESHTYDPHGNELASADPRLLTAGAKNFERLFALDGSELRVISADAGTRWFLRDAAGMLVYMRDSRGFVRTWAYDGLHRPVSAHVSGGDGAQPLDNVVEYHVYGDSLDASGSPPVAEPRARNLIGRRWRLYDEAGVLELSACSIAGLHMAESCRVRSECDGEADWRPDPGGGDWPARLARLDAALDPTALERSTSYDALGRVTRFVDPAGNAGERSYHVSGLAKRLTYTPRGGEARVYLTDAEWDPGGRPLAIGFGGLDGETVVSTEYSYDPETLRLASVVSKRPGDGVELQDRSYWYDAVGNLTHVEDAAAQLRSPAAAGDFGYDALYRLTTATGRALAGYDESVARAPGYAPFFQRKGPPPAETYAAEYRYDDGGNLVLATTRMASGAVWSTATPVEPTSNRAASGRFDANGNQLELDGVDAIAWTSSNKVASVTVAGGTERMLYDWYGNRRLRVTEGAERTRYFGRFEVAATEAGGSVDSEVERARVEMPDGTAVVRLAWVAGEPPPGARTEWLQLTDLVDSAVLEVACDGSVAHFEEYLPFGPTALAGGAGGLDEMALKVRRHGGQERDMSSGLYYYGMRYYAPWSGRWISPDPALEFDGLNLYAFVRGNPATAADAFGLGRKTKARQKYVRDHPGAHILQRKVSVRSSEASLLRKLQNGLEGTRNLAMLKLVHRNDPKQVLYIVARSMGIGKCKMTLRSETVTVGPEGHKTLKKRSHSEAVLRAVLEVGKVKVGDTTYKLNDFTVEYAASSNSACDCAHENCKEESIQHLKTRLFYEVVPYTNSKTAGKFRSEVKKHLRNKRAKEPDEAHLSEAESEDESVGPIAMVIDSPPLVGMVIGKNPDPLTARLARDVYHDAIAEREAARAANPKRGLVTAAYTMDEQIWRRRLRQRRG
jgi:insecticidal toxin complex protein TccC